ncbi:MAG: DUF2752 domain-containing protein [Phycisphaerales bacterium]|nr:MAG: DUF2752 domain-containing protein [Phycisphaerales bacterium]
MSNASTPSNAPIHRAGEEAWPRRKRRILGLVIALCAAGILTVAVVLEPAPEGLGTHSRVGLPECGWIVMFGIPCPTCGMTTAFAHAANGDIVASLCAQPFGGLLAIGVAIALIVGGYVAFTGSRVAGVLGRLWGSRTAWLLGALLLLSWVYKIVIYRGTLS